MPIQIHRNPISTSMWKWIGIANSGWPSTNIFNGSTKLRSFANMISSNATAVGCYSSFCKDHASSACVFSQPEVRTGTLVYSSGSPCKKGGKCTSSKNGLCEDGLCVIDA
ncbi:hypothetical protein KIN20_013816 [Parelaphostrongylus tenuis]|uniref:SCP domain-containing protein n=1 Tax=Parelaphostrongylus tenuis TaxID=148309 RepID=A0AAD5MWN3_PARTN|nr:hypothetical protein KIN20_013816 [Parelaphostrongylus tenuis]